ncbi:SGNH/GDSL hydrolase family protein [Jeotgalibacillus terrae]|uniref:SGNH/GDSL hydrolase family protein n=1 Tax=Jeotgalibacillus terrae TaxID=587735 RepID=A0ABW5ZC82_9BACL|nr:SGNH/GDSL hydrolase family protein [Jeotgalibacillus terrae]MBM7580111.1 lysophospholipase L1-like esterase [Jeotgalibacillus terrae]
MRIIALGDSNTKGEMLGDQNWTTLLAEITGTEVVNEGVNGHTTEDAKLRLESKDIYLNGDIVLFMFGTNDSVITELEEPKVSLTRFRENIIFFVKKLHEINLKPVLMTVIPLIEGSGEDGYYLSRHHSSFFKKISPREWVNQYNDIVREIAVSERVQLIDIWQHFITIAGEKEDLDTKLVDSRLIDSSGTHLTIEGAKEVYVKINKSLKQLY